MNALCRLKAKWKGNLNSELMVDDATPSDYNVFCHCLIVKHVTCSWYMTVTYFF